MARLSWPRWLVNCQDSILTDGYLSQYPPSSMQRNFIDAIITKSSVLVFDQPPRPTQPGHLLVGRHNVSPKVTDRQWHDITGKTGHSLSIRPWSSVPNSFSRSVSASRISIMPCAGIAICDLCRDNGVVIDTCSHRNNLSQKCNQKHASCNNIQILTGAKGNTEKLCPKVV